ncbi:MAG: alpha-L-glutamate ligase-like protein [Planctomycetota bacterium]|jgi:alpha-L-glutamate ligase-like protein
MLSLAKPSELRKLGIMGMNGRNVDYIARWNPRNLYPRVDDKLKTKLLAEEAGINVPKLYGVVQYQHEVKKIPEMLEPYSEFVIKPSQGSAGKGILVIVGKKDGQFLKPSGQPVSEKEIIRHVNNTLSGLYSLGGRSDKVMIEALVHFSDAFDRFAYQGVPDIRVIIYKGYPAMAMMRLPTQESDGKANLHQGAIGVGIDIGSGQAVSAVQHNHPVTHHPDTDAVLTEMVIPEWDPLMLLAARCYEVTDMGYLGVDIVMDKDLGPLILELNARPGLAIQIANNAGLAKNLEAIDAHIKQNPTLTPPERVAFAQTSFARY